VAVAERPWKFESSRPHHFWLIGGASLAASGALSQSSYSRCRWSRNCDVWLQGCLDWPEPDDRTIGSDIQGYTQIGSDLYCGRGARGNSKAIMAIDDAVEEEEAVEVRSRTG